MLRDPQPKITVFGAVRTRLLFDMLYVSPPSAALLKEYPQFEALNKKLTLSLLDQDGAVKSELASPPSVQVANWASLG